MSQTRPRRVRPRSAATDKRQQGDHEGDEKTSRIVRSSVQCPRELARCSHCSSIIRDPNHLAVIARVFLEAAREEIIGSSRSYQAAAG